jgi:methylmalonyl-CoA/ethylmalonyl-CoA epimerase
MTTIDHLGIAVKSIAEARKLYEQLGLRVTAEDIVAHEKVKVAIIPVGETRIELLEATAEDSVIAKFIAKRGEGLHHIALSVNSVVETMEALKKTGTRFISEDLQIGAGGHLYVFIHPSSTGGVLVELVQDSPSAV